LGGFDERLPFIEDEHFAARIVQSGRWITLPSSLLSSARRFETEGHLRRYILMSIIMGMHAAGVDEFFRHAPKVYVAQEGGRRAAAEPIVGARSLDPCGSGLERSALDRFSHRSLPAEPIVATVLLGRRKTAVTASGIDERSR
jgi:hypothetical protein